MDLVEKVESDPRIKEVVKMEKIESGVLGSELGTGGGGGGGDENQPTEKAVEIVPDLKVVS